MVLKFTIILFKSINNFKEFKLKDKYAEVYTNVYKELQRSKGKYNVNDKICPTNFI